jgi:aminoglycoside phosphotransferase (APT) family kinase protein
MPVAEIQVSELKNRLSAHGVTDVHRLTGGASSLTYRAATDQHQSVVIKVAPPGVAPILNRDVLRQARLMQALAGTAVAVPRVLWQDAGDPPDVPPLFAMAFVEGTSLEPLFDRDGSEDEAVVAERMANAARAMAALHAVDPAAVGLRDEPRVGLDAEIDRWCRLLETVDPALAPGWPDVAAALRAGTVTAVPPAVVHGDFRLGNLLASGSEIAAVIDWEIWTVGDPRIDVGWFLVNADPATYRRHTRYAGALPTPPELVRTYADARGAPVPDLDWFQALACFKSTATWALIVKHNGRRAEPDPEVAAMAAALPHLLARAGELLA